MVLREACSTYDPLGVVLQLENEFLAQARATCDPPCAFVALPRFKFLYIGNGNKVFILGVSWCTNRVCIPRELREIDIGDIEYFSKVDHARLSLRSSVTLDRLGER